MSDRPAIPLRFDADPDGETRTATAGAYVLVLATALPSLGVEAHSTYVGHERAATAQSCHLLMAPGVSARTLSVEHPAAAIPVVYARHRCVYDHAQRVVALLNELGHPAGVHVDEAALVALERRSAGV